MMVSRWTVDYGDGPQPVVLPHAWGQDVSVEWEGPAVYRTEIEVPKGGGTLRFHGVSYAAEIQANGNLVGQHVGMWDSFDIPLPGGSQTIEVSVTKSGGTRFPVCTVAGGFLPFVYHTFGGIYREVELLEDATPNLGTPPAHDELPYLRGLLHWGWYPDLGHPNPDRSTIRKEVLAAKELGFNLVKFCLWVPPHRYLDILEEEGMLAWFELPLWNPQADRLPEIANELERIVLQYRHHPAIAIWTVGCELSAEVPHTFRREMVELVRALTGSEWVKDNSGGAEMYGADLREYGTFDDFHPYCDLPFYSPVLDSLRHRDLPVLLGEFNDHDVHRDLARLGDELPFWASSLPELNAKGSRWQHDLPKVLDDSRFALEPTKNGHRELMESSRRKALFIRKTVHEAVRARPEIRGYVVTGWRDTPISSSGFFDDWGQSRFNADECRSWNGDACLHLIPILAPAWKHGGNRPGTLSPQCHFAGNIVIRVGLATDSRDSDRRIGMVWRIYDHAGKIVARGASETQDLFSAWSQELGQIVFPNAAPGEYRLDVMAGVTQNSCPLWIEEPMDWSSKTGWSAYDPANIIPELAKLPGGDRQIAVRRKGNADAGVLLLDEEGTLPMPFWRECVQEFGDPNLERWEKLLPVSPDRALDPAFLRSTFGEYEVLINRVDTRTYAEHPILVRARNWIVTTLRPHGGLGSQPPDLAHNPAGVELLRTLCSMALS